MQVRLWRIVPHGALVALQDITPVKGPDSLDEAMAYLPDGSYTTLRTYQHECALRLEDHFDRLEETARLAGQPLTLERWRLRQALRQAIAEFPAELELRLRIVVGLGAEAGQSYLAVELLHTLPALAYLQGVKTVTRRFDRQNPRAKLTATIAAAHDLRQALPIDVNEAILVAEDGSLLEGLSSNFYSVVGGVLWTADQGVLSGITRQVLLDEARLSGTPIYLQSIKLSDLPRVQEAFLTSASRGVLPICQVDEHTLGAGKIGPLTGLLSSRYNQRLQIEIEKI